MDSRDEKPIKKKFRKKSSIHRARLIVRNLDFSTTEDALRELFERFGDVDEIIILKRENGQLSGCGFVQFKQVQSAAKACHYLNGTKLLNRNIKCEFALPKDKYEKQKDDEVKIKEEPVDEDDEIKADVKVESDDDVKSDNDDKEKDNEVEGDDTPTDEEDDDVMSVEEEEEEDDDYEEKINPKHFSHDIVEGKTIFIKNVPFTAKNEDIKKCFAKYGQLYYALVCMDHLTEHSKGTAFVKFKNKEDADKCLAAKDIVLMGHTLDCQAALSKEELKRSHDSKGNKNLKADSRNLYLVKEGVVFANSKAAADVSASDMGKRLELEKFKTHKLRDLNMCVARTRLVVHNIPPTWNDMKLRNLFKKYAGPKAEIKEARIMKNMRGNAQSFGESKGFGYVTFTAHEAALKALRAINNNPKIFSVNKRPIVAFSIEDRSKLRVKEKRLLNSQLKNPNFKDKPEDVLKKVTNKKNKSKKNRENNLNKMSDDKVDDRPIYSGIKGRPGETNLRGNFKLRVQALKHREHLKKQRRINSVSKKALKETVKQEKQENKKKVIFDDSFSKMVQNYKKKLVNIDTDKKKWYE